MAEATIFVKPSTSQQSNQQIEYLLNQTDGIERALLDLSDGELKIAYDEMKISRDQIVNTLKDHGYHIQ